MTFEELLESYSEPVREVARRARALVLDVAPTSAETVSKSYLNATYGYSEQRMEAFCYIAPFNEHVNLGFMEGAELSDPAGLLEGTGKKLRHVKLKRVGEVEKAALRELVEQAANMRK